MRRFVLLLIATIMLGGCFLQARPEQFNQTGGCSDRFEWNLPYGAHLYESRYWVDMACTEFSAVTGRDADLLMRGTNVKVTGVTGEGGYTHIQEVCDLGDRVLACVWPTSKSSFEMIVPVSARFHPLAARIIRHETFHILLHRGGVPGGLHHPIMRKHDWY